ncbi:hypothetical protein WJX72_006564 [[Myrmecia] bisecta]|uniref:Cas12f1-like TNB domain-containing protein n=1 Tax=[Myrmecia] bisecta TaxID=41462 RepID=A0AAW1PGJ0_9CHLO
MEHAATVLIKKAEFQRQAAYKKQNDGKALRKRGRAQYEEEAAQQPITGVWGGVHCVRHQEARPQAARVEGAPPGLGAAKLSASSRGHAPGCVGGLRATLPDYAHVVNVDEFRTSKVCPDCDTATLFNINAPVGRPIWAVLKCSSCGKLWNRDTVGTHNMERITLAWLIIEPRPASLCRPGSLPVGAGE